MNLGQMIKELKMEIANIREWITQLAMCIAQTDDTDPDYMYLLLEHAGAIDYLQELKEQLEKLKEMKKQQQKQQGGGEGEDGEDDDEDEQDGEGEGDQDSEGEGQDQEGDGDGEEQQGQGSGEEEQQQQGQGGNKEGGAQENIPYGKEEKFHEWKPSHGDVKGHKIGDCRQLKDLIGEAAYNELKRSMPLEEYTKVQFKEILGREFRYEMPRPDGKIIKRTSKVVRIQGKDGTRYKVTFVPEIHTVVLDEI